MIVDDQSVFADNTQTDEKIMSIRSAQDSPKFLAALRCHFVSVSHWSNCYWLNIREASRSFCGSALKHAVSFQPLDVARVEVMDVSWIIFASSDSCQHVASWTAQPIAQVPNGGLSGVDEVFVFCLYSEWTDVQSDRTACTDQDVMRSTAGSASFCPKFRGHLLSRIRA